MKEPFHSEASVDFSKIEHSQPSEEKKVSESVQEELFDRATQLLLEEASAVQPDLDHTVKL